MTGLDPTGFRWRLHGPPGPPMPLALLLGEAVRASVFRAAEKIGLMPLPAAFHGGDGHGHAHWLSEDMDADGLADHVTLHAPSGLPEKLLPVLARGLPVALRLVTGARLPAVGEWRLTPIWFGRDGPTRLWGPGQAWVSETPFVTPDWVTRKGDLHGRIRPGRDVAAQVQKELARRDLPPAQSIEVLPGAGPALHWVGPQGAARSQHHSPPPDATAARLRLQFAVAMSGPLALGFAAHFGLGLLTAEDAR